MSTFNYEEYIHNLACSFSHAQAVALEEQIKRGCTACGRALVEGDPPRLTQPRNIIVLHESGAKYPLCQRCWDSENHEAPDYQI